MAQPQVTCVAPSLSRQLHSESTRSTQAQVAFGAQVGNQPHPGPPRALSSQ
jgi:hypothetical protein